MTKEERKKINEQLIAAGFAPMPDLEIDLTDDNAVEKFKAKSKITEAEQKKLNDSLVKAGFKPVDAYGKPIKSVDVWEDISIKPTLTETKKPVVPEGLGEEQKVRQDIRKQFNKLLFQEQSRLQSDGLSFEEAKIKARENVMNRVKPFDVSVPGFVPETLEDRQFDTRAPATETKGQDLSFFDLLQAAISPQTRMGEEAAKKAAIYNRAPGLITPEEYAEQNKIDDNSDIPAKQKLSNYKGFYAAAQGFLASNEGATAKDAIDAVRKDLKDLPVLLAGNAPEDRYTTHKVTEGPNDPYYKAFARQRKDGMKMPILTDIQKDYVKETMSARDELFSREISDSKTAATAQLPEIDPLVDSPIGMSPASALRRQAERQKASQEAEASKREETGAVGVPFWSTPEFKEFLDNPEATSDGFLWERNYPSGASVEGPIQWVVRSALILPNIASRGVYEGATAVASPFAGESIAKSEAIQDALPKDALYQGHPMLRNIANNRGLMEDSRDLAKYGPEEWQEYAVAAGAIGLLADILITPFDPGVSHIVKGGYQAAKTAKVSRAIGKSAAVAAADASADFARALGRSYLDDTVFSGLGRSLDPMERAAASSAAWLKDEAAFKRAYNFLSGEEDQFNKALKMSAVDRGNRTSRFRDQAMTLGEEKTLNTIKNPDRWKGLSSDIGIKYERYLNELDAHAMGLSDIRPDPDTTAKLRAAWEKNNPKTDLSDLDVAKAAYASNKASEFVSPLVVGMGKKIAVDVIETTKGLRGGASGLNMVTPKLFLNANDMKKLSKILKSDDDLRFLSKIMKDASARGDIARGLVPSDDWFKTDDAAATLVNRTTVKLTPNEWAIFDELIDELTSAGFLSKGDAELISNRGADALIRRLREKNIPTDSLPAPEDVERYLLNMVQEGKLSSDDALDIFKDILKVTTADIRTVINASIEQTAFASKLGMTDEILSGASTAVKEQLMDSLAARHLRDNWFRRRYKKSFDETRRWDASDEFGMPPSALAEVNRLQGELGSIERLVRADIQEILKASPEQQKIWFDEEWLKTNKPTRNDAIVAVMLGPIKGRVKDSSSHIVRDIAEILIFGKVTTPQDALNIFRGSSIEGKSLKDLLTTEGEKKLAEHLNKYAADFDKINSHAEYMDLFSDMYGTLKSFTKEQSFWINPGKQNILSLEDVKDVSAAALYIGKSKQLAGDTVNRIFNGWSDKHNLIGLGDDVNKLAARLGMAKDSRINIPIEFTTDDIKSAVYNRAKRISEANAKGTFSMGTIDEDWQYIFMDLFTNKSGIDLSKVDPSSAEAMSATIPAKIAAKKIAEMKEGDEIFSLIDNIRVAVDKEAVRFIKDVRLNAGDVEGSMDILKQILIRNSGIEKGTAADAALFGKLDKMIDTSKTMQSIRKALFDSYNVNRVAGVQLLKYIEQALNAYRGMAYRSILAARPAFHAINMITAPMILWGTIGGRAAINATKDIILTTKNVWLAGRNKGSPGAMAIAVTDPMGRSYTNQDVWEMALGGGALRSQTALILSARQFEEILDDARFTDNYKTYIKDNISSAIGASVGGALLGPGGAHLGAVAGGGKYGNFLSDMTEFEDQWWRLSAVVGGLKKGEAPHVSLGRGKRALYDYGSLMEAEKFITARFFMFYAFSRLNLANTMATLISNPKRFANIYRTSQSPAVLGGYDTSELNFYKHSFLLSRPVINFIEGVDKESHYEVMPSIPMLDGLTMFAEMLTSTALLNPAGVLAPALERADPLTKAFSGQPSTIQWTRRTVDPKDLYTIDQLGSLGDEFWDTVIRERPVAIPSKGGEDAYKGHTYKLSDAGHERYLRWKNVIAPALVLPGVYASDTLPVTLATTEALGLGDSPITGKGFEAPALSGVKKRIGATSVDDQRGYALKDVLWRLRKLEEEGQ